VFIGLEIAWLGKGEKGKKRGRERETSFILGRPKWI